MSLISESQVPLFALPRQHSLLVDEGDLSDARSVRQIIAAGSLLFFLIAWLRYAYFGAGVFDLGTFDQAVYLISRGKQPFIPTLGYSILADHGAFMLYPLALLYVIYPSVLWLFATQAVALAGSAWFVWRLARQSGVSPKWGLTLCAAWMVYPAVVMPNVHDFHPEVLAVPALLGAVFFARDRQPLAFLICLIVALGTKEVVAITVAAMGLWLFFSESDRRYGAAAVVISAAWFLLVTQIIIPMVGQGHQLNGYRFYSYMGATPSQIIRTMLLHPSIPLRVVSTKSSAIYLLVLLGPIWWGLRPTHLAPLLPALPCVAMNLLSQRAFFHNPFFHYSLVVAPFAFLALVSALAKHHCWLKSPWMVATWLAIVILASLGVRTYHALSRHGPNQISRAELQSMVDMVGDTGGVLSTHQLTSHLMHREMAYFVFDPAYEPVMRLPPPSEFDWVLLDFHEPGLIETGDFGQAVLRHYQSDTKFIQLRASNGLYLFHRISK